LTPARNGYPELDPDEVQKQLIGEDRARVTMSRVMAVINYFSSENCDASDTSIRNMTTKAVHNVKVGTDYI